MAHLGYEIRNINPKDFFLQSSSEAKIKFLLRYAVFAPSTHNSQPWLFEIRGNSCKIYNDPNIQLKEADPINRDLYISFGCLIENLIITAKYFGVLLEIKYSNEKTQEDLIAEIFFQNLNTVQVTNIDPSLEPLLIAITKRVNARGIFEPTLISEEIKNKISSLSDFSNIAIHLVQNKEQIQHIAELTAEGLKQAYANPSFRKEMSEWMHNSLSKKRRGIPGYSLRMPTIISFFFPAFIRRFNLSKKVAQLNIKSIGSAPIIAVITSNQNSKQAWLDIGRLFERITLNLNILGIKTSIFVASIEMGFGEQIKEIIGSNNNPQFLFCIGYMNYEQKPNLRMSVEERMK
ncbi:MAG: hypothetical protein AAB407_02030 [Patescibacteria group bacterium]